MIFGLAARQTVGRSLALSVALVLLVGCALGPNFKAPRAPDDSRYTAQPLPEATHAAETAGGGAQRFVSGRDIPGDWWTLFHSEPLKALIEEALKANPDLQSAQAALHVAVENLRAQRGAYFPTVSGTFSASRNSSTSTLSPPLNSSTLLYNLYQAQLEASWSLDVFGANRRQVEALRAQADAQRFQLESTYLALTTNVVAAAIQEASLRAQIAATQDIIKSETDALTIMRRQKSLGQIAGADVAAQEALLAQSQQVLPPLEKQLAQQRDLLTALSGRFSDNEIEQTFELSSLQLPQDIPVTIPSELVEQRPDIRIADENLHAASAQVGVAIANMFPQITLSATEGSVATKLGQLFVPGNGFWTVGAGLAQPLFQGGALLHKTRAARAAYEQASANYKSAVIAAFQNVADVLYALQFDSDSLKAAAATERAARKSLDITRKQLELGQTGYLAALTAEQTYQQAAIARVQAQVSRLADTAALFQALGGGWWNRADAVHIVDNKEGNER